MLNLKAIAKRLRGDMPTLPGLPAPKTQGEPLKIDTKAPELGPVKAAAPKPKAGAAAPKPTEVATDPLANPFAKRKPAK